MPNFLVVANSPDSEHPVIAYGDAERTAALLDTFEQHGYNVEVRKVTAPLTGEALTALRGLSSAG